MATTEYTRRELFEAARDHLGQPAAEALMAVTIPANTDLATRQDLELLRAALLVELERLRREAADHRAETTAELAKLTTGIEKLRSELYRWFLPAVAAVVGVVGYVTG